MSKNVTPISKKLDRWNKQNISVVNRMNLQHDCIESLIQMGFTILKTEIDHGQAVVWIHAVPWAEDKLKGVMYRRKGGGQPEFTFQAQHQGCRVQWTFSNGGVA